MQPEIKQTSTWKGNIACQYVHKNLRLDTKQVKTSVNSYVYALFEKGSAKIKFDSQEIEAHSGDFLIFPPHIPPVMISTSDDYEAICLIVSSVFVSESPMTHNIYQTANYSLMNDASPIVKLPAYTHNLLRQTLLLIMQHINQNHKYTNEALQSLYGLLLSDLMNVIDNQTAQPKLNQNSNKLFIEFNKLLRIHFREHHDITFYADQLGISPRYLSMVTKQISHTTVASFINRHLMLEACWLLKTTNHSILHISEILHFADQASFSKFFKRINGNTPLQYRRMRDQNK